MFTYNLIDHAIENGQARVTFEFFNGSVRVSRTWIVTDKDDIDRRITAEIAALEKAVTLNNSLVKNNYVVTEKPADPVETPTALEIATRTLYQLKEKVNLGVLKEDDQEFVDAVTAYKMAASGK